MVPRAERGFRGPLGRALSPVQSKQCGLAAVIYVIPSSRTQWALSTGPGAVGRPSPPQEPAQGVVGLRRDREGWWAERRHDALCCNPPVPRPGPGHGSHSEPRGPPQPPASIPSLASPRHPPAFQLVRLPACEVRASSLGKHSKCLGLSPFRKPGSQHTPGAGSRGRRTLPPGRKAFQNLAQPPACSLAQGTLSSVPSHFFFSSLV